MPTRTALHRSDGLTRSVPRAAALLILLLSTPALAQTGKLSGRVTDDAGGAIIGATVVVVGTEYGAAADLNGEYVILRIPPGTYSVRFSSVGFGARTVENVRMSTNQTTELDATLAEETAESGEVVVTAERPLVDITQTSTVATIGREEIALLPVQDLADVVNLQAGVVDGHFRGGRLGEVQYQVDGVSVNNPYDNTSTLTLDRSVLQEVQVISGTFDAEYGQALSGVVNAVLRRGEEGRYEFSFETFGGDYVAPGLDSTDVRLQSGETTRVAQIPYVDNVSPLNRQNYQASLSGPVPVLPRTTFLVNGQRFVNNGLLAGERRFVPTDSSDFQGNVFNPTGDGAVVPIEFDRRWSLLGKVSNTSIPGVQVDYQFIGTRRRRMSPAYAFRFNPDGARTQRETSFVHGVDVQHVVSPRLFYEVALRQNVFDYADYAFESLGTAPEGAGVQYALPADSPYFGPAQPVGSQNYNFGAIVQGVDLGRFVQRTNGLVFKSAVTAQPTNVHLLKAGVEFQRSAINFGVPGAVRALVIDGVQQLGVVRDTLGAEVLQYAPIQGAAFVQDRIEWGDLRVRAGLRVEYFDARSTVPSDLANPANAITGAPESVAVATTPKIAVAPRLGVSFPILDRASLFFSYGHFYQQPGLGIFFQNADYSVLRDLQAGAVSYGVLGNPDLRPEFTAQYEFGFKSIVTPSLGLDVSLFYKDIRDLLGVEFVQTYTAAEYARFTNVDFGGVRGVTVSLDQRGLGPVATTLDYTYQIAIGNSSDPRETATIAAAGGDPRPRQIPFDWDQRHTVNATAVYNVPDRLAVTGILRAGSGRPFTPTLGTGFGAELGTNAGRKAAFATVDLRAEAFFSAADLRFSVFGRVFNLFNALYQNGFVYSDTGSPFYTVSSLDAQRNPDPTRFADPRRVEIGISFNGARPSGR